MIDWLKKEWLKLTVPYCNNALAEKLWTEIKTKYISKTRHYHNLAHIYIICYYRLKALNLKLTI